MRGGACDGWLLTARWLCCRRCRGGARGATRRAPKNLRAAKSMPRAEAGTTRRTRRYSQLVATTASCTPFRPPQTAPEGTIFIAGNVADGVCLGSYPLDATSNYQLWVSTPRASRTARHAQRQANIELFFLLGCLSRSRGLATALSPLSPPPPPSRAGLHGPLQGDHYQGEGPRH